MDGPHFYAPDHVFGEATAFGMIATRSEQKYSYKTDFVIWRENQAFGRQNISMSQPPLESNPIGTNSTNITTSPIESIPIGIKIPDLRHKHDQRSLQHNQHNLQSEMEKHTYQRTRIQTHNHQTHH